MPKPTTSPRRPARALVFAVRAALLAASFGAPAIAGDGSPSLLESPRARVSRADYEAEMARLPADMRAQFAVSPARLLQMLNSLFLSRAIANDTRAAMDRDPVFALQVQVQIDKAIAQARYDQLDRQTAAAFDTGPERYAQRARELYLTRADRYRTPERVRVAHLLIKTDADDDPDAKARAEALRARAAAGAPFADLVREASEDPATQRRGGDLGLVTADKLEPTFAEAAFALKTPGELSPVVKSSFGYHVIQFKERAPPKMRTFEEVRSEILAEIRKKLLEDARVEYQEKMFKDPPVEVNGPMIRKINDEATRAAPPAPPVPPPAKR